MQRNTLLGGLALLAAGGLIGAGAMISSSAMADTPPAPPADQLTMINVGTDGEAVKCTFDGADAAGLLPVPAAVAQGIAPSEFPATSGGSGISGSGTITGSGVIAVAGVVPADGTPIEIDMDNPPAGVDVSSGVVSIGAVSVGDGNVSGDLKILSAEDARDGTPEECAAMLDGAVTPTPGGGQTIVSSGDMGGGGATTGDAPAKP